MSLFAAAQYHRGEHTLQLRRHTWECNLSRRWYWSFGDDELPRAPLAKEFPGKSVAYSLPYSLLLRRCTTIGGIVLLLAPRTRMLIRRTALRNWLGTGGRLQSCSHGLMYS